MRASLAANLLYFPVTRLAGERIRRYLREYRTHDRLGAAQLQAKQADALEQIVAHARRSTIHYRETFAVRNPAFPSDYSPLDGLEPVSKDLLRNQPERFISNEAPGRHERKTTSGSTGHPLTVLKNRDALARERAATWRAYGWAGIKVAAPQGLLWGIPHSSSGRLRTRTLDFLANRKRLSMFGVSEAELAKFHARLERFRPEYLYGYVSALVEFARFLEATDRRLPTSVKCLVTTSELLDETSRALLEDTTGLKVYNEYGCGEVGSIAHECEAGRLHVMSDNLVLECLSADGLPDGFGELVVTDLHNMAMPLIRYRLGDLGNISSSSNACDCGKPYPVLDRIVGRAYDIVVGVSGKKYHPESILYVMEDFRRSGSSLPAFQAVQHRDGAIIINLESDRECMNQIATKLQPRFHHAFGDDLEVSFATTEGIRREPSGKLRVVKRDPAGLDFDAIVKR